VYGEDYVCRDGNGDGKIDRFDGASGCVEQKPKLTPGLIDGVVDDSGSSTTTSTSTEATSASTSTEAASTSISTEAISTSTFTEAKTISTSTEAGSTSTSTGAVQQVGSSVIQLDPTVSNTVTISATVTTTPNSTGSPVIESSNTGPDTVVESAYSIGREWHIEHKSFNICTNSGKYHPAWEFIPDFARHDYFFSTAEACCHHYKIIHDCVVVDDCSLETIEKVTLGAATESTETEPEIAFKSAYCTEGEWHIEHMTHNTCSNSGNYPPLFDIVPDELRHIFFFATAEACCNYTRFDDNCIVVDDCSSAIKATENERAAESAYSTNCEWSISRFHRNTCTNSGNYPPEFDQVPSFARHNYFFLTAEACCNDTGFHDNCIVDDECPLGNDLERVSPVTVRESAETELETASKSSYSTECEWHNEYSLNTCTNSGNYPPQFDLVPAFARHHYFFTTAEACCDHSKFDEDCIVVDKCSSGINAIEKVAPGPVTSDCKWHIHLTDLQTCTYSSDYPPGWHTYDHLEKIHLFETGHDCCNAWYPKGCLTVNECPAEIRAEEKKDRTTSSECKWHTHLSEAHTCTNSNAYPEVYGNNDQREHMLFATAEECCGTRFPDVDCITRDDCTPEFYPLEPNQFLEVMPWKFGDDWKTDEDIPFLGSSGHSVTNLSMEGRGPGASSDISLKIYVPVKAKISCMSIIDVHMPFEYFTVTVNGEERQEFNAARNGGDRWWRIYDELSAGNNEIVYRVQNNNYVPDFHRQEDYGDYGSGKVWLDHCRIVSYSGTPA